MRKNTHTIKAAVVAALVVSVLITPSVAAAAKSKNAWAKSVKTSAGTISPKFTKKKLTYTVKLPANVSAATITVARAQSKAKLAYKTTGKYKGIKTAKVATKLTVAQGASKSVLVRITAQNGKTKKVYKIVVSRAVPTYKLTVNGGSGSGTYKVGQKVTIKASTPAGKVFSKWSDGSTSAVRTYTMPAKAVTLTAAFVAAPVPSYYLQVVGGTGSGTYRAGTQVTVKATVPQSQVFSKWSDGNASATRTYTMPAKAVTLTAVLSPAVSAPDTNGTIWHEDWIGFNKAQEKFILNGTVRWDWAQELGDIINNYRVSLGLPEFIYNQALGDAAMLRSAQNFVLFEHMSPNGTNLQGVYSANGTGIGKKGENVASFWYSTPQSAFDAWVASSLHHGLIKETAGTKPGNMLYYGVGCIEVQNTTFFVLLVGQSADDANGNSYQSIAMPSVGAVQSWDVAFAKSCYDTYPTADWSNVAVSLIDAAYK
jgi:uncharacterized protein YkwD